MRFDTFLQRAAQRHPALVFQVSWANGSTSSATSRPRKCAARAGANERALGPRSRLAAASCARPPADEEASSASSKDLGRKLPRKASSSRPTTVRLAHLPARDALEPLLLHPVLPWETMERLHDSAPDGGGLARRVATRSRCSRLRRRPRGAASRRLVPLISSRSSRSPSRRGSAGTCSEIVSADELRGDLRQGGRLRHAHAAGHRAGRREESCTRWVVPRRAEPASGRVHRAQAAPAPATVRHVSMP